MANEQTKEFLGRGWSFPPKFERNDEVLELQMVSLEEDVRESLSILLSTLLVSESCSLPLVAD